MTGKRRFTLTLFGLFIFGAVSIFTGTEQFFGLGAAIAVILVPQNVSKFGEKASEHK